MIKEEIEKLAIIQRDLIVPAEEKKDNTDIIIKIRDGIIVWAESSSTEKCRVDFKVLVINKI